VFYKGITIFLVYVDDGVLIDLDPTNKAMLDIQSKSDVQDEGE
jgi:hypothetical protein